MILSLVGHCWPLASWRWSRKYIHGDRTAERLNECLTDWSTDRLNRLNFWQTGTPTEWIPDRLADRISESLTEWLTDWISDRLVNRLTESQADWPTEWVNLWQTGRLNISDRLADRLSEWVIGRPTDWMSWPADRMTECLTGRPTDWMSHYLADRLTGIKEADAQQTLLSAVQTHNSRSGWGTQR